MKQHKPRCGDTKMLLSIYNEKSASQPTCFHDILENDENSTPNKLKIAASLAESKAKQGEITGDTTTTTEKEYRVEEQEQVYKRLMHLLKKSKFFSSFLMKKIQGENSTPAATASVPLTKRNENKNKKSKPITDILSSEKDRKKLGKKLNLSEDEIEAELNLILESSGTESEEEEEEEKKDCKIEAFVKPKYFEGQLREYQETGLKWLIALHENGLNGILADEMGLGKTIQTIAFICHLMQQKVAGPYLIVAPLSTLPNWQKEFHKFAPKIPLVTLYGNKAERDKQIIQIKKNHRLEDKFVTKPVVIATYETIIFEKQRTLKNKWRYIVVDEGQRLKNKNSGLYKMLNMCKSLNRLLLTGTPLQNDLTELWSLLNFLMPEVFDDLAVFESWFDAKDLQNKEGTEKLLEQEKDKQIVTHLREILKPFMLRRLKTEVCPDIPLKKEVVIYAPMTDLQRELYTASLNRDFHEMTRASSSVTSREEKEEEEEQQQLNQASKRHCNSNENNKRQLRSAVAGPLRHQSDQDRKRLELEKIWSNHVKVTDENSRYLSKMNICQRAIVYKKIINHPFLIDDSPLDDSYANLMEASGKFMVLDAMLKKLHEQGHKVLIFSTWTRILDYIEDYLDTRPWQWTRLDGSYTYKKRKDNIDLFNNDPSVFLFLITTRAGGVGLNLMGADTVIIFDSDWNPQADIQAMARCHRIGQTRPVMIYKLCTKGSYDEIIVDRAAAKRKLEKLVISKELNPSCFNVNMLLAMKELLARTEHEIVNSEKGVFTEEELDKLMDRSDLLRQMEEKAQGGATE